MEALSSVSDSVKDSLWARSLPDADGDREGGGGNGFPNSFPNSRNNLSSPGCICLAIIGKLASNSPNDLISCFGGVPIESPFPGFFSKLDDMALTPIPGTAAGTIFAGSYVPIRGREM